MPEIAALFPGDWFAFDVMRQAPPKWDWVALMIDVDPGDLAQCSCDFLLRLYIHPKEYRPEGPRARYRWVRIPGKHRSRRDAWGALRDMTSPGIGA